MLLEHTQPSYVTVSIPAREEPPGWLEEEEGTVKEQKPQSPPPSWKSPAGVQPPAEKKRLAGDSHLARQALPHGEEVGLLPRGQTHVQMLPSLLQGDEQPLSAAGTDAHTLGVCCITSRRRE